MPFAHCRQPVTSEAVTAEAADADHPEQRRSGLAVFFPSIAPTTQEKEPFFLSFLLLFFPSLSSTLRSPRPSDWEIISTARKPNLKSFCFISLQGTSQQPAEKYSKLDRTNRLWRTPPSSYRRETYRSGLVLGDLRASRRRVRPFGVGGWDVLDRVLCSGSGWVTFGLSESGPSLTAQTRKPPTLHPAISFPFPSTPPPLKPGASMRASTPLARPLPR